MLVIGTAGHIDHGKSSIVKRLTGTDPDRLPEEKERGMTIDLGFAFYNTPQGESIAFVDVPGHERFVKNMVAGVGGIDVAMLVVAADDGWMPQSEEHFQIVRLLRIRNGLIVINKVDLAENDWLDLLTAEIKEKVKGSYLQESPIFKVSVVTGAGFDDLSAYLNTLSVTGLKRQDTGKPRLYIDRAFSRPGAGTVVTGTLRGGTLSVGQTVSVWPSMASGRIRSLHANNTPTEQAHSAQRTAVSFTGLEKNDLPRGGVVTDNINLKTLQNNPVLALDMELLRDIPITLEDRRRLLLIVGTSEIEGEVRLWGKKEVKAGERAAVFFQPDEPLLTLIGDRFIARLPTPMLTIGGGEVLDRLPHFPKRREAAKYDYLNLRQPPNIENSIISELKKEGFVSADLLLGMADYHRDIIEGKVKELWRSKTVQLFEGQLYHKDYVRDHLTAFKASVQKQLDSLSHLKGLTLEQMAHGTDLTASKIQVLVNFLVYIGEMVRIKDTYSLTGRDMKLSGLVRQAHDDIISILKKEPYSPPSIAQLASKGKPYRDALKFCFDSGECYKCGSETIFLQEVWDEITDFIRVTLGKESVLNVADIRDRFGFSRKYIIPILEETDRLKLTARDGDNRVKGANF